METSSELMLTNLNARQPVSTSARPVHGEIHLISLCISLVDMSRRKWSLLGSNRKWRELRLTPCSGSKSTERYKRGQKKRGKWLYVCTWEYMWSQMMETIIQMCVKWHCHICMNSAVYVHVCVDWQTYFKWWVKWLGLTICVLSHDSAVFLTFYNGF